MSGARGPRLALAAAALLCVLHGTGAADEASLQARHDALGVETAGRLETLADWCQKKRCFGRRDEVYEALLEFDPLHAKARERLGYEKNAEGVWEPPDSYKRPKNWDRGASAEAARRLAAELAGHLDRVLALLGEARTLPDLLFASRRASSLQTRYPADERLPALLRDLDLGTYRVTRENGLVKEMEEAAARLRSGHPQDLAVRGLLGEAVWKDAWLLVESVRTLEERNGLAAAARMARDAVQPTAGKSPPKAAKIELPWQPPVAAAHVRVVGTQAQDVLRRIAVCAEAAGALFQKALGREPQRRADLAVYAFQGEGEIDTFLAGYPVVDNPTLQRRKEVGLDLVYADGRTLVLKDNPPDAQADLAVNEVLNVMFADTFLASEAPKGWHAEGISRYLAWLLTGTRLSVNVGGRYAGQGQGREVPGSEDPWLSLARGHVKKGFDLELLLGRSVGDFGPSDAMVAYAFAVYLLEGHEHAAADFVVSYARHADGDRACRETLGMPRAVVTWRFTRWLDEVVAGQETQQR